MSASADLLYPTSAGVTVCCTCCTLLVAPPAASGQFSTCWAVAIGRMLAASSSQCSHRAACGRRLPATIRSATCSAQQSRKSLQVRQQSSGHVESWAATAVGYGSHLQNSLTLHSVLPQSCRG